MSKENKDDYVPHGLEGGYPRAPSAPNPSHLDAAGETEEIPKDCKSPQPDGYTPVPQADPNANTQPLYVGGQPPSASPQPAYAGQQSPFAGQQPPYLSSQLQPSYGYQSQPIVTQPGADSQPQYVGGQPSYGSQQPPYSGQQSPYTGPQPPYASSQPQPSYGYQLQPIVTQPGAPHPGMVGPGVMTSGGGEWMTMPVGIPNCPRGLEYLTTIDQLWVEQKVELFEVFTGFETNNKFTIKNSLGQKVYYAVEESDCCNRNCCGEMRSFDMKIFDNYRNEIIHLNRPLACDDCCFPCCFQSLEVSAPPGNVIGSIEQEWSICTPMFNIKNHLGDIVLRIKGPMFRCYREIEYKVLSLTGSQVGKICKKWVGFSRDIFTDADFFGITFPIDLDVRMKATLLGATFLINMMFFENSIFD